MQCLAKLIAKVCSKVCALSETIKRGCLPPSPHLALIITVAETLCCFAHLIRKE